MPFLLADDISRDDFLGLIQRYYAFAAEHFESLPLMLAFAPAEAVFKKIESEESFFRVAEHGRFFSPEGELKWRQIGDKLRIVFLGYVDPMLSLQDRSSEMADLRKEESALVLWGERTDTMNEWIEQQVPNRFQYPVPTSRFPRGRVVIVIEKWVDAFGFTQFSRYHSVKETVGEHHAEG